MKKNVVVLFAKRPVIGKVKTRLAQSLGHKKALHVYTKMLDHMCHTVVNKAFDAVLYWDSSVGDSDWIMSYAISCYEQRGKDLGERMYNASKEMLALYEKVLIIGVDVPEINEMLLNEAFKALDTHDVCIGPTQDGGYYLIGMKQPHTIFDRIQWGSSVVFEKTIEYLRVHSLRYALLKELRDIDTQDDLANSAFF